MEQVIEVYFTVPSCNFCFNSDHKGVYTMTFSRIFDDDGAFLPEDYLICQACIPEMMERHGILPENKKGSV